MSMRIWWMIIESWIIGFLKLWVIRYMPALDSCCNAGGSCAWGVSYSLAICCKFSHHLAARKENFGGRLLLLSLWQEVCSISALPLISQQSMFKVQNCSCWLSHLVTLKHNPSTHWVYIKQVLTSCCVGFLTWGLSAWMIFWLVLDTLFLCFGPALV